jgi:hypothetical protein
MKKLASFVSWGALVIVIVIVIGVIFVFHKSPSGSGDSEEKVIASIPHPSACSLLQNGNKLAAALPGYTLNGFNNSSSSSASSCQFKVLQGANTYGAELTISYDYFKQSDTMGTPKLAGSLPNQYYETTFIKNYYAGDVQVGVIQGMDAAPSQTISSTTASVASSALPTN